MSAVAKAVRTKATEVQLSQIIMPTPFLKRPKYVCTYLREAYYHLPPLN